MSLVPLVPGVTPPHKTRTRSTLCSQHCPTVSYRASTTLLELLELKKTALQRVLGELADDDVLVAVVVGGRPLEPDILHHIKAACERPLALLSAGVSTRNANGAEE